MPEKEYIEREAVAENESICRNCFHSYVCEQFNEHKSINNKKCHFFNDHFIPTADVVKVVRCKDCKRFEKASVEGCGYCMAVPYAKLIMETDFCSDGERRE